MLACPAAVARIVFSQDGREVTAIHTDGSFQRFDLVTGRPLNIARLRGSKGQQSQSEELCTVATLSPNGRFLLTGSRWVGVAGQRSRQPLLRAIFDPHH